MMYPESYYKRKHWQMWDALLQMPMEESDFHKQLVVAKKHFDPTALYWCFLYEKYNKCKGCPIAGYRGQCLEDHNSAWHKAKQAYADYLRTGERRHKRRYRAWIRRIRDCVL